MYKGDVLDILTFSQALSSLRHAFPKRIQDYKFKVQDYQITDSRLQIQDSRLQIQDSANYLFRPFRADDWRYRINPEICLDIESKSAFS
jgi:hypothetical protein